jgi:tRNA-splicing ligase RtcB
MGARSAAAGATRAAGRTRRLVNASGRGCCRLSAHRREVPAPADTNNHKHLGTLGTGNHFIEVCLDEAERVWFMLHSGSRGVGNAIGSTFIALAQADMRQHLANLPDRDLAYLEEGSAHFDDYVEAVGWAQDYARHNRAGDDGQPDRRPAR